MSRPTSAQLSDAKQGAAITPVIFCGGTGTRLLPLSLATHPKQYWALAGEGDDTLLLQTHQRLAGIAGLQPPLLICNEDHRLIVAEQMRQIGLEAGAILLEPVGRNTAPAVAVGALQATDRGEDPLLLVLAADHVIRESASFRAAVTAGMSAAEAGQLVTFGIVPTATETGCGYIEAAETLGQGNRAGIASLKPVPIARFVEKPDRTTAEQFLASGRFNWSSGIFLFKASTMLAELERLAPEVVSTCRAALGHDSADLDFLQLERAAFAGCPNVAIEVAVMGRTDRSAVLPLEAGWRDVGSWSALWETTEHRDAHGNVLQGHMSTQGSRDWHLRSEHRLVVGLEASEPCGRNRRRRVDCKSRKGPGNQDRCEATGCWRQPGRQGTPKDLSPLGFLHRCGRTLPLEGEANLGETWRKPFIADASPPC